MSKAWTARAAPAHAQIPNLATMSGRFFAVATALLTTTAFSQEPPKAPAPAAPAPATVPAVAPEPAIPEVKALSGPIQLKDGDTFVFLGDSITHQCLYTQYVEDYFY